MTKTYIRYRARVMVLAVFIIFSWAGLCARLFQVQVLNGEHYQRAVLSQSQKKQVIPANRGNIYDRDNRPLTRNIIHYTFSVNPSKVKNKNELAVELSKRTGQPKEKYLEKLSSKSTFSNSTSKSYAIALYELSKENSQLDKVAEEITSLNKLLDTSLDFKETISNPIVSKDDKGKVMALIAKQNNFKISLNGAKK